MSPRNTLNCACNKLTKNKENLKYFRWYIMFEDQLRFQDKRICICKQMTPVDVSSK